MQSKLGKRTDLKQCCTDRRDAQMQCDATRIPQLTTATTSKQTFTQKRRQEEEGEKRKRGGERGSRRSAANIPFQESFKTKMTKF